MYYIYSRPGHINADNFSPLAISLFNICAAAKTGGDFLRQIITSGWFVCPMERD